MSKIVICILKKKRKDTDHFFRGSIFFWYPNFLKREFYKKGYRKSFRYTHNLIKTKMEIKDVKKIEKKGNLAAIISLLIFNIVPGMTISIFWRRS